MKRGLGTEHLERNRKYTLASSIFKIKKTPNLGNREGSAQILLYNNERHLLPKEAVKEERLDPVKPEVTFEKHEIFNLLLTFFYMKLFVLFF